MNAQPNTLQQRKPEAEQPARFLVPANFQEAMQIAEMLAQSEMVPKTINANLLILLLQWQWGLSLGFSRFNRCKISR